MWRRPVSIFRFNRDLEVKRGKQLTLQSAIQNISRNTFSEGTNVIEIGSKKPAYSRQEIQTKEILRNARKTAIRKKWSRGRQSIFMNSRRANRI